MRIVENTPDTFVMVDEPWLAAAATWAAALGSLAAALLNPHDDTVWTRLFLIGLAVAFAYIAWLYMPFQRITFDRSSQQVRLVRWRLGVRSENSMPLSRVMRARQQSHYRSETGQPMWRLVLDLTAPGSNTSAALSPGFGGRRLDAEREALNRWLDG